MAPPRRDVPMLDQRTDLAVAYAAAGSIAALATSLGVSVGTVRRALLGHGIPRNPRNNGRRPSAASVLDDPTWLRERYASSTGVEIAAELGVTPTTIYRAMRRHSIDRRRHGHGTRQRAEPRLLDAAWLVAALPRASSTKIASELDVSPGTLTNAYRRANLDPSDTASLYYRGRRRPRPTPASLRAAWETEESIRDVARRLDIAHTTARVWLAEVGIFATSVAALSKRDLLHAIKSGQSIRAIADLHNVSTSTVRVELHRHGLFKAHHLRHLLQRRKGQI